jgi:hypothetical protein
MGEVTMKTRAIWVILALTCFVFGSGDHCHSYSVATDENKQVEIEKFLKKAIIGPKRIPLGRRTDAYFVDLNDGKIKGRGVLRFTDDPRPKYPADSYKYTIAAYELDKLLELNLVPPTVERQDSGKKASLQIVIEAQLDERKRRLEKIEPPDPESFYNTLEDLHVFENLVFCSALCEYGGNLDDIMIDNERGWKVWRIDLTQAFAPYTELIPDREITRCSRKLYKNLLGLDNKEIRSKVKKYLNKEEINAVLARKKLIIEKIEALIKEKGEEKVLF